MAGAAQLPRLRFEPPQRNYLGFQFGDRPRRRRLIENRLLRGLDLFLGRVLQFVLIDLDLR